MLFEDENLINREQECRLRIIINDILNKAYLKDEIDIKSENLIELLYYLTDNTKISTDMRSAIEYEHIRMGDVLHKRQIKRIVYRNIK